MIAMLFSIQQSKLKGITMHNHRLSTALSLIIGAGYGYSVYLDESSIQIGLVAAAYTSTFSLLVFNLVVPLLYTLLFTERMHSVTPSQLTQPGMTYDQKVDEEFLSIPAVIRKRGGCCISYHKDQVKNNSTAQNQEWVDVSAKEAIEVPAFVRKLHFPAQPEHRL